MYVRAYFIIYELNDINVITCILFSLLTFQIHIHIHIFAFPPIHQITHIASNCAPDAPKTAWRRTTNCVPTQMAIRRDIAPTASGRS